MTEATAGCESSHADGEVEDAVAVPGSQVLERGDRVEPVVRQVRRRMLAHGGEAGAFGQRLAGAVLATQQALGQGEVRQEGHAGAVALVEDAVGLG